ncbi:Thermophilic serine proteinase [Methanosarcinales archaeon]|nr:Thermophilic serine proteinase [Methanosarcinales archaeon]
MVCIEQSFEKANSRTIAHLQYFRLLICLYVYKNNRMDGRGYYLFNKEQCGREEVDEGVFAGERCGSDNMTFLKFSNILLFFIITIVLVNPSAAQDSPIIPDSSYNRFDTSSLKSEHKPGELLVKYTKKLPKKDFENFYKAQNMTLIKDYPGIGYHLIRVDESRLEKTIDSLSLSDKFEDAEPNYIVKALKTPNDSRFNELWAMNNTGQTGGTPDADIDAPQAWDFSTGSKEVIVAVIDTGVDYTHEDLESNMWTNPGEIPDNDLDDDNNGFVDDYYGWDFAYNDNDPMEGNFHGTHVSGTLGGAGNNNNGVAGVSWNTHIMAVKFLDDEGFGWTSDAIDAINYATMMGADIMCNGWGGGRYSSALEAAIQAADNAGILFVAAAGNEATNTDQNPHYPSSYDIPNVMSIAATDQNDILANFSNYGTLTVDIGAPGVDILSSVPDGYASYSGTSMAAPHVSGAAALLKAFNPSLTHLDIKEILMNSVDPLPSLYGKTVTGGRLNVHKAITLGIVCPVGCNYRSIQKAIDAANPGATILVKSGTYYENVDVNKQLTLRGSGVPVVDARGRGSAITLAADRIVLDGFTVTGGASYPEAGIKIISNNNTLMNNNVSNNSYSGIILESSRNNVIYNNVFNNTENIQINNSNNSNWNITKQPGTNIIGGLYLGGNSWTKPDGTGFSQKCEDGNFDGICDLAYALDSNNTNIDYLPFSAKGPVHNINKGTNYIYIQAAIDHASPGDEIHVDNGTYYENVNVNKKLTLLGIGMPVVNAGGSGSAITLSANGITLEGFTTKGTYISGAGIRVTSNNNNLIDNDAQNNYYGIYLYYSSNNTLIGNNANLNDGDGIVLEYSNNNTLSSNNANWNNYDGIVLKYSNHNTLISNNANSNYGSFYGDLFYSNGIILEYSNNNTLNGNNASNNDYGIYMSSSSKVILINNTMKGNKYNFGLYGSSYPDFDNQIDTTNLVDGKSVYYIKGATDTFYDSDTNAGTFYCIDCVNVTLLNLDLKTNLNGIFFWNTTQSKIQNVDASNNYFGISLSFSNNNILIGNNANSNCGSIVWGYGSGISLYFSRNNTLNGNNANWNDGDGISLSSSSNNTLISNTANSNYGGYEQGIGISVSTSNNNTLISNTANSNYGSFEEGIGISVSISNNNTLISNTASNNDYGIYLSSSSKDMLINNTMKANKYNFGLYGSSYPDFDNQIDTTNLVDGKSVYYIKGATDTFYDSDTNAGTFYCISCVNVTLINLDLKTNLNGIFFRNTTQSKIQNVDASNNSVGIFLSSSSNNKLYHNNLTENTNQALDETNTNSWDIGYPSGGNYWSDYTGLDLKRGPGQDIPGSDGIGDIPYNISGDGGARDRYPIMNRIASQGIIVISPNGAENWTRGTTQLINWTSTGSPKSYVKIELLKPGVANKVIISSTLNDGSHPWLIPVTLVPGTDYKIKITNTTNWAYTDTSDENFIILTPIITVVSPNGRENWTRGTTQTIRWNSSGSPGTYVKIELLKPGVANKVIISSTLNDGSHPWLIPGTQIPGDDYKVKITSTANVSYTDTSDNNFNIPTPSITVVSPNGRENWTRGTTQIIRWNSTENPKSYVKIELLKPGVANKVIIASTLNDGSHSWLIPVAQAPGDYKVKITSTINASNNDISDDSFTVPAPSFTVVSPSGPENWIRGTTQTIRWNSTENPKSYVKIELIKPGTANKVIISATLNDGSHSWLIPAAQTPGSDYKVKVTSTTNASNNDISDDNFMIPAPSIAVVSPNDGENWTRGTTQTIRWNSTENPKSYVKIELLKPGTANKVIIASTLNDGSHPWPILATQFTGDNYRIKITSMINTSNNDTSDNFSIVPPKITVTSPNGGQTWIRGKAYPITWNYTGNPGTYVKIELLKGGALNRTILASTLNDKSQSWTIPTTQIPGTDYKIKITSTANLAYNDISDSNFTIAVPIT